MPEKKTPAYLRIRSFVWPGLFLLLAVSFFLSSSWLALCAGLALFLFGMQSLEEGLRQLAGGKLEQLLTRSTKTPFKSLMFGISSTMLVQSSSLVSLLTIAFTSTGLITLAGGIAIIFGTNLGTTSGIWLLAMAGQSVSLGPLALPLLVFGVLLGFSGERGKAVGWVLLGIGFLFLGIDQMKGGFSAVSEGFDPMRYQVAGILGVLMYAGIGLVATVLVQSSHASLMLTLAALASGQVTLFQALAIAVGTNLGTTITAILGSMGGARAGQRLALAHVLFNLLTGVLALSLLEPLSQLVSWLPGLMGLGNNELIQLALFHTLFNAMGVILFWPWQTQLAGLLERWLPSLPEPAVLISGLAEGEEVVTRARYLDESALASADAATHAVVEELQHLSRLSIEVICHALYLPIEQLRANKVDEQVLRLPANTRGLNAETLYRQHIKGVYADLLDYMSRLDVDMDAEQQEAWTRCQLVALQLVDAVKDAKHLQKNLGRYLDGGPAGSHEAYLDLRRHLLMVLRELRQLGELDLPDSVWEEHLQQIDERAADFDMAFRQRMFIELREHRLSSLQMSSLMNDLGYASRIVQSLRNVLMLGQGEGNELFRSLRQVMDEEGPLIRLE
jgi:phosphate:Na+ symporter